MEWDAPESDDEVYCGVEEDTRELRQRPRLDFSKFGLPDYVESKAFEISGKILESLSSAKIGDLREFAFCCVMFSFREVGKYADCFDIAELVGLGESYKAQRPPSDAQKATKKRINKALKKYRYYATGYLPMEPPQDMLAQAVRYYCSRVGVAEADGRECAEVGEEAVSGEPELSHLPPQLFSAGVIYYFFSTRGRKHTITGRLLTVTRVSQKSLQACTKRVCDAYNA